MPNPSSFEQWRTPFDDSFPSLSMYEGIYKHLHRYPELPAQESRTATFVADHLETLGYEVQRNIGGCGVVGVLSNGKGKTVLLRSQLDASPLEEKTGLHYASKVKQVDSDGQIKPVMHCCGDDMNMACLLGAVNLLHSTRRAWSGTLICLFQPNQERLLGAQAMIDDGLFGKIPLPDIVIAHNAAPMKVGTMGTHHPRFLGFFDSLSVRVYGKSTHSSTPELRIDPILMAGGLLSRIEKEKGGRLDSTGSITCSCSHAGIGANTIPEFADFTLDTRSFDPYVQNRAVNGIKQIIREECRAANSPRSPRIVTSASCPSTDNDSGATEAFISALNEYYGDETWLKVDDISLNFTADDFVLLGNPPGKKPIPYIYWNYGVIPEDEYVKAEEDGTLKDLPSSHNAKFAPETWLSLEAGIEGLAIASLTFFQKERD